VLIFTIILSSFRKRAKEIHHICADFSRLDCLTLWRVLGYVKGIGLAPAGHAMLLNFFLSGALLPTRGTHKHLPIPFK
jgi:hypothetical protein